MLLPGQDLKSLQYWLALSHISGLGGEGARRLLAGIGLPELIFAASAATLQQYAKPKIVSQIVAGLDNDKLAPALQWLTSPDNYLITLADEAYPALLLKTDSPPILLYAKGRIALLQQPALAVIGSRHATPGGISNAEHFSQHLSEAGWCVVSGLAHGIDTAAHRGALRAQGSTIAVVGTGLDRVYPASNRELAHQIAAQGLLLSEFALGTAPLPSHFPRRNRIISGLSQGCLVVEASLQSGSLITARLASEQGREVFAIPGSIHAPQAKGCHALIKQGAKLVEAAADILDELGDWQRPIPAETNTADEPLWLQKMGFDPIDLDTLSRRTSLTIAELSAMLLPLELAGQVGILPGGLYQRLV